MNYNLQSLFFEITKKCNACCEHCGSRCDGNTQGEEVSAEDLKRTLKDIAEHYDPYYIYLNVTGGEPLIFKERVVEILQEIKNKDIKKECSVIIGTNGMLLTEELIDKIKEIVPKIKFIININF